MKKNFEPTKEQLEKLAKVADEAVVYREEDNNIFLLGSDVIWQPHEDRDQIAMVISGITAEQKLQYDASMSNLEQYDPCEIVFGQTVHPSISCEKLLEVVGDG